MELTDKTEKRTIGKERRVEVTVVMNPLTKEEAREMYPYRPHSRYSESQFGDGNTISDDIALLLSEQAKRCGMCIAPTRIEYLRDNACPDCDGRSEYNGKDPRTPVN